MCGIFGIIYDNGSSTPEERLLSASGAALGHRGPDGLGIFRDHGVGLVHTRLSLVDLDARSDQPMWDPSGRYCLVYNGEIYNFTEMRVELESQGASFRTTSDTEVILQSIIIRGVEDTLSSLEGMFAFAFYDKKMHKLVLVRDRFGIKPLHLYQDSEKLLFASELKALRPWVDLQPNNLQMLRYLMNFGAPIRDHGFYGNVDIVPPGTVITIVSGGQPVTEKFCDLPSMISADRAAELEALDTEKVVDLVDEQMQKAVDKMMFADAAVGALCSGGVDSSLLMAMAARRHSNLAIFHADVVGPLSEFDAASALAKHLKLDLHTVQTRDDDFVQMIPEVLYHYEQPFSGHPHSVPFMMVSKLVQAHGVKGVLTGEGSDECFLGYNYIAHEPYWDSYHNLLKRFRAVSSRIPVIGGNLWRSEGSVPPLVTDMMGQFEQTIEMSSYRKIFEERMQCKPGRNIRTLDLLGGHLRTLLHRNDTMGMSASIEARFPFLSETLVETAINLPYRHKIRFSAGVWEKEHPFLRDKWVIRKVADRYVPKNLSQRKKRGFDVSALQRIKIDRSFFSSGFLSGQFKLGRRESEYMYEQADQRLTMKMMMLEAWGQMFIRDESLDSIQTRLQSCVTFTRRIEQS